MKPIEIIKDFLNVPETALEKLNPDTLEKMIKACSTDDFMELHHFGYELTLIKEV